MSALDTLNLVIDEKVISYAKIYASLLKEEFQRKRAYASLVALYALVGEIEKTDNDVQKAMTLFRNPVLNEQYEISDFYVNNWHIDVRVIVDGDSFLVPKSHFDNDIQPDFYAVVKVNKSLTEATLLGFVDTAIVEKNAFDYHYNSISLKSLISYDDFLTKVNNTKVTAFSEEEHEFFRASYLTLIDEEVDVQVKNRILKHLFECAQCRTEFCCFTGFEMVNCNMGKYPDLLEDQTLNIIGAQSVDDEKYAGKEETIHFTDEEENEDVILEDSTEDNNQEESSAEREETVSDILDELFGMDEDFIEIEPTKEKDVPPPPLQIIQETEDLEIIEEPSDLEESKTVEQMPTIEKIGIQSSADLEIIDDEHNINYGDEDVVLLENEPVVITEEELALPEDTATVISDEIETPEENVQKVIVDYDEYGEPIYSYITNVGQEEILDESTEIEPLGDDDDDILNEEFETYPQQDDIVENLGNINSGVARPVEYLTNDDIQNVDAETEFEEYKDEEEVQKDEDDEALDISLEDESVNEVQETETEEVQEYEEYSDDDTSDDLEEIEVEEDIEQTIELEQEPEEESEEEIVAYSEQDEEVENQEEIEEYSDTQDEEYQEEYQDEEYDEEYDENEDTVDIPEENIAKPTTKKSLMIVAMLVIFALVGCGAGAFFFLKKPQQAATPIQPAEIPLEAPVESQEVTDMFGEVEAEQGNIELPTQEGEMLPPPPPVEENVQNEELPPPPPVEVASQEANNVQQQEVPPVAPLTEEALLNQNKPSTPAEISNSIANAFSPNGNVVSLRAVNWLCAPQLFTDNTFKAYLQNLDNILKLNLRKNILDVSEKPQTDSVTVKMAIDNMGNLLRVAISEPSGSEQIDNIVLQSINETFEGEKSQILSDSAQKADKYYLKVVIKL